MSNPKVSILMSVYNGEKYLCEAIDSILGQSFYDFEFLIINDGSTDKTHEILKSYDDARIRILEQENIGLTKSLNKGLSLARGQYIARMDDDDISEPGRLARQVEFLDEHPSVGLLGINGYIMDEKGEVVSEVGHPISHDEIMAKILLDNKFIHSSIMMRKELLERYGCYSEEMTMAQDYELILKLSTLTNFANLDEPLHKWRKNSTSGISVTKRQEQILFRDNIRKLFLDRHFALDKKFSSWLLINFKNSPRDALIAEYLYKVLKESSFNSRVIFLKLKILYVLAKKKALDVLNV